MCIAYIAVGLLGRLQQTVRGNSHGIHRGRKCPLGLLARQSVCHIQMMKFTIAHISQRNLNFSVNLAVCKL